MAFVQDWIRLTEKTLTAAEVRKLPPGTKVTVISADRHGECQRCEYIIVQSGKKKILSMRDWLCDRTVTMEIRDNENKRMVVPK